MDKQYNVILKEQMRKFREDRNYSHQYVAQYLQLTRSAYTNYENGFRLPDIFILDKLARLYNVSIEAFLYPPTLYNSFKELHNLSYDHDRVPDIQLDENEKRLIYFFRQLSDRDKDELLHLADYKTSH
ncbi:MAG: helix-turn-helix transcriptional regulator [Schaedlerella sp.]|nr:helix-turn-helix transcriptional regulator [Clostridiales bacterium]MDY3745616.1 helix-turn-helix transcriptional regulator [Lachnospiraceae bacterium]MDY4201805.1 helix-turn-helix transcriptional regulator [Schaedlerella sp.]